MFQNLNLFQTSAAMAHHAGTRQAVVASNIANADTPKYQAMQLPSFQDVYRAEKIGQMHVTRPGHLGSAAFVGGPSRVTSAGTEPAPNGNTVSLEDEMMRAVRIGQEHNRALAIYRHGLTLIRAAVGRN